MELRATGELVVHGEFLALKLPGEPALILLAGGEGFEGLRASGPPAGSLLEVEGALHPSHADQPPGLEVASWKELERHRAVP